MTIGEILRDLLVDKDLTQKQLAESLNLGISTLSNYLNNNREPDYGTLKRLADYFSVSTDYLLDHRVNFTSSHNEDELLHIYRQLTDDQQELFIEQGKLFVTQNNKKRKTPGLRIADDKTGYKKNGAK